MRNRPNIRELTFEEYIVSLNDVSVKLHDKKIKEINKRINILKTGHIPIKIKKGKIKIPKSYRLENLLIERKHNSKNSDDNIVSKSLTISKDKQEEGNEKDLKKIEKKLSEEIKENVLNDIGKNSKTTKEQESIPQGRKKMFEAKGEKKLRSKPSTSELKSPKKQKSESGNEPQLKISEENKEDKSSEKVFSPKRKTIPITSTRKILQTEVQKDEFTELREILKDDQKRKEELVKCEKTLDILKNRLYTEIQDDLFRYLELDSQNKVIIV